MALTKERRNEIAYEVLKHMLKERGFEIDSNFRRRVGNIAKQTGLPFEEVLEFGSDLTAKILLEVTKIGEQPTEQELSGERWGH